MLVPGGGRRQLGSDRLFGWGEANRTERSTPERIIPQHPGLEYRFNGILQREFHASETQADGSGAAIGDFLVGDKRFTTFVEIKKPSTPLFGASLNRGKAWSLSRDLTDAISQILEHKASGQIRIETQRLHDSNGQPITQRAYDPKVLLIIGHWNHVESVPAKW